MPRKLIKTKRNRISKRNEPVQVVTPGLKHADPVKIKIKKDKKKDAKKEK